jgi:Ser/Thr protein kinase RdoA (MazF antagonist)
VDYCRRFVQERRSLVPVLEDAKDQNRLRLRPIHGDPKVNNIMIDEVTGQAVSIVDLDTVKPGLVHYDIGDCLRSCCNPLGEETADFDAVCFETDLCRAILQGYLPLAQHFLDGDDYAYLYDAIRLIAFELGLRFFTDYLEGNVYFKAKHRGHNLTRAIVQFKLAASIERQEATIRAMIDDLR